MLNRRLTSAFIVALVISGLFTYWLSQKYAKKGPAAQVAKSAGEVPFENICLEIFAAATADRLHEVAIVVAAAIELCQREGAAEVIVAEGPGHWRNAQYLVTASGLAAVLRHYHVPFIDLNTDNIVCRKNLGMMTMAAPLKRPVFMKTFMP